MKKMIGSVAVASILMVFLCSGTLGDMGAVGESVGTVGALGVGAGNWSKLVEEHQGKVFVKFYAPWCGHCKKLAPTWDQLASSLESSGIKVVKVNCDEEKSLCSKYEVTGFPTLKLFAQKKVATYSGDRSLDKLAEYAIKTEPTTKDSSGSKEPIHWSEGSLVVPLTNANFTVAHAGEPWLIAFYADWCGFCKKMSPELEQVAQLLDGKVKVGRANIDAIHAVVNRGYNVTSVPTFFFIKDGYYYNFVYKSQKAQSFVDFVETGYKSAEARPVPAITIPAAPAKPSGEQAKPETKTAPTQASTETATNQDVDIKALLAKIMNSPYVSTAINFALSKEEGIVGAAAAFIIFLLGFILGRATASPAAAPQKQKTN